MIRRWWAVLVALALLAAACTGERPTLAPIEDSASASILDVVPRPTAAVEAVRAVPTPTATPEVAEADPWQVWVAVARDHVGLLETFDAPDGDPVSFEIPVINPTYFGTTLALMVTEGSDADEWVKVQLPVRPNGTEAWVRAADFDFQTHRFHAEVDLGKHQVKVWDGDELIVETEAVIGRPDAPTPIGRFFVNDLVPGDGAAYGSWILSLSAFSETLETFDGGLPVIAIHGTNRPELVGQELSSGCVRVPNDIVQLLAERVPLGTPVDIFA